MQKDHQIILSGKTAAGVSIDQAIQVLGRLFKREPERLRALFAGKSWTIPGKLTQQQAESLHAYLNKAGIPCEIRRPAPQPDPKSLPVPAFELEDTGDEPVAESAPEQLAFSCPKCNTQQERGESCVACGLVFDKYFAREAGAGLNADDEEAETAPDEQELLETFVGDKGLVYMPRFDAISNGAKMTWHWPAFFVPFYWALYRKMWFISAVAFITQLFWPISNIVFGLIANQLYYQHARGWVGRLSRKFRGQVLLGKLEASGGTSRLPVLVAVAATILLYVAVYNSMVESVRTIVEAPGLALSSGNPVAGTSVAGASVPGVVFLLNGKPTPKPPVTEQKAALVTAMKMAALSMQFALHNRSGSPDRQELESRLNLGSANNSDGWGRSMRLEQTGTGYRFVSPGADGAFDSGDEVLFNLVMARPAG